MADVYCFTSPSGRRYVGMTSASVPARWAQHLKLARQGSPNPFHAAIRKYGPEAFVCEVIASGVSADAARAIEIEWIAGLGTLLPAGYNATAGGEGCRGAPEVRAQISAALRGRTKSPETRERMRAAARLRMTAAAKKHLSAYWSARGGVPRG